MLTGVHILNTLTKTNYTSSVGTLIIGLFALAITIVLANQLYNKFKGKKISDISGFFGLTVVVMVCSMLSMFSLEEYFTRETYKTTTYQITIDSTVKYNDFINTYDVLEHDGSVYIVKLKLEDSIKK